MIGAHEQFLRLSFFYKIHIEVSLVGARVILWQEEEIEFNINELDINKEFQGVKIRAFPPSYIQKINEKMCQGIELKTDTDKCIEFFEKTQSLNLYLKKDKKILNEYFLFW